MRRKLACWLALGAATVFSQNLQAESWRALAGAESPDHAIQVIGFLPNEMWIHAGDSITWAFPTLEPHSATFLTPGLVRPAFTVGCPATNTTPDPSSFDNSSCVNSGRITTVGLTYTVTFPKPGNYRLVCLVHVNMTATIHVLDASLPLPHDQAFYDEQGARQARALLTDHDATPRRVTEEARGESDEAVLPAHHHMVIAATGEVVSTSGGINSVTKMRFMEPSITIHAGETVEWDSLDVSGHTITFGTEPPNVTPQTPPSTNVFADADGARHAIIYLTSDNVHSGLIAQAGHERIGIAQAAPPTAPLVPPPLPAGPVTRFRVTFMNPGVYPYICAFHDQLGMKGEVIVLP
jgi:plastocyanin